MTILVFNSGSSSLKFQLFDILDKQQLQSLVRGKVSAWGAQAHCVWTMAGVDHNVNDVIHNHQQAAEWIMLRLRDLDLARSIIAVGHRIVHGGDEFSAPVHLTDAVINALESLNPLAPLHNPLALQVIRASQSFFGIALPQIAVFDTAFFHHLPDHARYYAVPTQWARDYGIKRYGFHGIAHRALYERFHDVTDGDGKPRRKARRIITLQLGQGCSIAAIQDGVAIETSMGFTPLEGLIMGTRPGDIDAGVLLHLMTRMNSDTLTEGLYQQSGLLGLSGVSANMGELLTLEAQNHAGAIHAVTAFCHRVRKYIGAYLVVLGGADAVIFGGGISENFPALCARICKDMEWCGLEINGINDTSVVNGGLCLSTLNSKIAAYIIPVNEELVIAQEVRFFVNRA